MKIFIRKQRAGFTIIELLVTIAILAILAALFVPWLNGAKVAARRVQCLNAQKQWYTAFLNYSSDNDDWIPREGYDAFGEVVLNNWSQVASRRAQDVWYNALPPELERKPSSFFYLPPAHDQFYANGNFIHCPSARFPAYASQLNYVFPLFSLAMNSQLIVYGAGPTTRFQKILQSGDPTKVVIFLDNLLDGEKKVHPNQDSTHLGQPSSFATRFSARHGGQGNLAFADGHVASFAGKKVVQTDDNSPLKGGPILPATDIVWDVFQY